MDTQWFTVGEIEKHTRIPERTIRRYLDIHGHHIKTKRQGRSVLIADEAVQVIRDIRGMYDAGMSSERVEEVLAQSGLPMVVEIDGHDMAMTPVEALLGLQKSVFEAMAVMTKEISELKQEVAASREESEGIRQFIDERLDTRDRILMETLREMQVQKQKKKRWPWSKKNERR